MIITTSQNIEGHTISEYVGIVSAAQIMILPGGNKAVQRSWQSSVEEAIDTLLQQAESMGADAVIAARFEPFGSNICATGTAVKLNN